MKFFELKMRLIAPLAVVCSFVCFCCLTPTAQAATTGGRLTVNGTLSNSSVVSFSILDSQIHSGVFQTSPCDGINTDAFVLQGGSPNGCDNGDSFETTQTPGNADVAGFHIKTFYQFGGSNTRGTITASPDTGFLTLTNNTDFAFTGTITLQGTTPSLGSFSDSWTSGLAAGGSVTLALNNESSNYGGFNVGDQCSAPTVGQGTGTVGTATGLDTCGAIVTVTLVNQSGTALAYTVAPANPPGNNGNPYDRTEDTLVGIQNNSGATLNSIVLASSDTSNGGLFGFDRDGACNLAFHSPAYPWCGTAATGYEGPDNTFSNIMTTSCPIFGTCATSGTVNFTTGIPNGGNTWLVLEASSAQSLIPPTMQVQTTPPITFNAAADTDVPVVFNNATNQLVQNDVTLPGSNNLSFPSGIDSTTLQFQSTNRFVSDAGSYTNGTPFATFVPFDHAGNDALAGSTGNGAKYEVLCVDATHTTPLEGNCPDPNTGTHIRAKDIFDLPKDGSGNFIQPAIAFGTTVSFIHWFPNTIPSVTSWSSSNMSPNPACTNVFMPGTPTFACDLEDILVNKYGPSNGSGSDKRKGDYFLGYNVPMLLSLVKVNGKQVNTPGQQVDMSSSLWFRAPLTIDFLVTPAQCPTLPILCGNGWLAAPVNDLFYTLDPLPGPDLPGTTDLEDLINCPGENCVVPGTSPAQPGADNTRNVEFIATPPLPPDGKYLVQWSAADTVKTRERNVQLLPLGSPIPCPNPYPNDPNIPAGGPVPPCYSTKLFSAQINVDNTPPSVICNPADVNWHNSEVIITCPTVFDTTSGLSSPAPAGPGVNEPLFLRTSGNAGQETSTASTNSLQVCDLANNCVPAGPVMGNKIDMKPPSITITTPANLAAYNANQVVKAAYGCTDGGSGVANCTGTVPNNSNIDTTPNGVSTPKTFTVNSTDNVGNTTSPPPIVNYSVSCHYAALGISPSSVTRPAFINVTASIADCVSAAQTVKVKFTLSGPLGRNCGTSSTEMFTTPWFTIKSGTSKSISFPFPILKNVCAGMYTITTTTLQGTNQLDSTSATLTVH